MRSTPTPTEKLRKFFETKIFPTKNLIDQGDFKLNQLGNIGVLEIKSLRFCSPAQMYGSAAISLLSDGKLHMLHEAAERDETGTADQIV